LSKYPSTWEIPIWKLIKYFFILGLACFFFGVTVASLYPDWWLQLTLSVIQLHLHAPYLFLIEGGLVGVWIWDRKRMKKKHESEKERKRKLDLLLKDV